jgi:nitroreductase
MHTTSTPSVVLEQLFSHASCRAYRSEPVPDETLTAMIAAAQRAATSSNLQMWSVVAVREEARKAQLAHLCGDQAHIVAAPLFLAWCADRNRLDEACERSGLVQNTDTVESFLVAAIDVAIAMQNATVAAEAMGYGTCYIGGLRNNTADVVELLRLPRHVFPIAGMTVGFPARAGTIRPRLSPRAVMHEEAYQPVEPSLLAEYDEAMRATGIYRDRQVTGRTPDGEETPPVPEAEYGWMQHSGRRVSTPARPSLRAVLTAQGFPLQ